MLNNDEQIIRSLAGRVAEIAALPEMKKREEIWYNHNALKAGRPLVLCFPEGAWCEILPEASLLCKDGLLRSWEMVLRQKIFCWENIHDDNVIEPFFDLKLDVGIGDFGAQVVTHTSGERGSYVWDAPINDIEKDFDKLHFREISVDFKSSQQKTELATKIFGDLLPYRMHGGGYWWTMGLTWEVIRLVGLENLMMLMYDEPSGIHKLMSWMRDEHLNLISQIEKLGVLTMNNRSDYVGSGGVGYSNELNQKGDKVKLKDLWGFAESQETVGVSPSMFGEFVFQYQLPILEKFGLNSYGCCEGVHERWDYIKQVPNLRRVSVSPWCDQEKMADYLKGTAIFSRKFNPSYVCINFDENIIREDIKRTFEIAKNNIVEIILKDTHTVQNDPTKLNRWVQIALEEAQNY